MTGLPPIPRAMFRRWEEEGRRTLLAVPVGFAITETWAPGEPQKNLVSLTANPLRISMQVEPEAVWYVKDGAWKPFDAPPCALTLGEIAAIVWGLRSPYAEDIERYAGLHCYRYRDDAQEAELLQLDERLREAGVHLGWPIVPRAAAD